MVAPAQKNAFFMCGFGPEQGQKCQKYKIKHKQLQKSVFRGCLSNPTFFLLRFVVACCILLSSNSNLGKEIIVSVPS